MRNRRQTTEEGGPKVPSYIVTFSDMVTLLLTFFVMLLSLARAQDPELFGKGRNSFVEALKCAGLGILIHEGGEPAIGELKPKHYISEPDETTDRRTIDARIEEARRILDELKKLVKIVPPQTAVRRTSFSVASVHFLPGRVDLDVSAKNFLTGFCRDLLQSTNRNEVELFVLGLAPDEKNAREKWLLSAQRAEAVADFLREELSLSIRAGRQNDPVASQSQIPVYSWGAGHGGDWVGPDSPFSEKSQILIGIMRTDNENARLSNFSTNF